MGNGLKHHAAFHFQQCTRGRCLQFKLLNCQFIGSSPCSTGAILAHTVCNAINKPLTVKNETTVPASRDAAAVSSSP